MADDLSTYWQDLPSRETPLDATTLNAWGSLVEEQASAATLAAAEATAAATTAEEAAEAATAPTDTQVAALLTSAGSQTRTALGSGITASTATGTPVLWLASMGDTGRATLYLEDVASHGQSILDIRHRGDGSTGADGQAYGINIANHTGARPALTIHQYSAVGSSVRIDNTDLAPSIVIWNTENSTQNPGKTGTGHFFQLKPYGTNEYFLLSDGLTFLNNTDKNVKFQSTNATSYTLGVDSTQNINMLSVFKRGTGAGVGVFVQNAGTSAGLQINQTGTGPAISAYQGSTQVARVNNNGEYENLASGGGILLRSPDGTRYRVSVANGGAVSVVAA